MKVVQWLMSLAVSASAAASTYTITGPHLTMHVGDPVPPLIFRVSTYTGAYAAHFTGEPARRTTATSASAAGSYPIQVTQGTLRTVSKEDDVKFVNGTLTVLPASDAGAQLQNGIRYPQGFFDGPQMPAIDVTKNQIAKLVGDGVTDNAAAFAALLSQNGIRNVGTQPYAPPLTLYFPPGVYATSQPLTLYGKFWMIYGSGAQSSVIKLLPNSAAFNTGKAVQFFSPQSVHGNENFHDYMYNMGFEIGPGNPDAIPFTTVQNNSGAVRNVQIWADDSVCPYGVNLRRGFPGPLLLKNVAIYGCANAISSNQNEYNVVAENLTTEAQTALVIDSGPLKMSIRHWLSDNSVPAVRTYGGGGGGNLAILDSALLNGGQGITGINVVPGSTVYLKNVTATGYSPTEVDAGDGPPVKREGNIAEAWTGNAQSLFNSAEAKSTLGLPARETPEAKDPPLAQWTKLSANTANWTTEIGQSKSATIYAPPGVYAASGSTQVTIPDSVNHLQFYQAKFPTAKPKLVLTIAGRSTTPLIIDGCIYESCEIVHTGSRPIVINDTTVSHYTAQDGAGDVYLEDDVMGGGVNGDTTTSFFPSQHVWARQLNIELRTSSKLACNGCTLWVLGYKTEQPSPSLVLANHAKAEIFGFFYYQNQPPATPGTASMYLTDSSLFATGWTKVDIAGRGQPNWVVEKQGGKASSLPTRNVNTSQQLGAYLSLGGGKGSSARSTNGTTPDPAARSK